MEPSCRNTEKPLVRTVQLAQMMSSMAMNTVNPSTSFEQGCLNVETTKEFCNLPPGNNPENSLIVREALRMDLPHHLVLRTVNNRLQTHGSNYTDLKDLVADLFAVGSSNEQEVPMETNQLEDAMMIKSTMAKKALRMGVPCHLLKQMLRDKILSTGSSYTDLSELLKDMNMK